MYTKRFKDYLKTFYKYQIWVFKAFALWKLPDESTKRRILINKIHFWHITLFWVLLFDVSLLMQFISNVDDLNEVIKVFFIFATALSVLAKFLTIKKNNVIYADLVEQMSSPVFQPANPREDMLFIKAENLAKSVRNSYLAVSLCALNVVLLTQYIVDNSELPLSAYVPFNLDSHWRYSLMYLYQYFAVSICCYMNICFESISAGFLIYVKGQLDILSDRLEHLGKDYDTEDEMITFQLKDCIFYYEKIFNLTKTIESLISFPISVQILCSVFVLVANFYAMSFVSCNNLNKNIFIIFYFCFAAISTW